jgi:hypothetical protein
VALVVVDQGELLMLQYIMNMSHLATVGSPIIRLYLANLTLPVADPETVADTDPTECDFTGYTAVGLTATDWTTTQSAGISTAFYTQGGPAWTEKGVTFTMTTGGDIYGYYVTAGTNILWIEEFSGAPFTLPGGGGDVAIVPKITLT